MKTVQRGYYFATERQPGERVLVSSDGEVLFPAATGWTRPVGRVVCEGVPYERWSDVPASWLGVTPWWR